MLQIEDAGPLLLCAVQDLGKVRENLRDLLYIRMGIQ